MRKAMRPIIIALLSLTMSCTPEQAAPTPPSTQPPIENPDPDPDPPTEITTMKITANNTTFTVTLASNDAARALGAMLPFTASMGDLNGNEKYYYLPQNLPTSASSAGTIQTGDLMLFGANCLVLFYETFSSSYAYTRIGRIEHAQNLASIVGSENVTIKFEL